MLNIKNKLHAELLNLEPEELEEFARRLSGFLFQRTPTKNNILEGMFIYQEILDEKRGRGRLEEKKLINFGNSKHIQLKKHALKILELHESGMGATRISKYLLTNHSAKISRGTIETFLRLNNG